MKKKLWEYKVTTLDAPYGLEGWQLVTRGRDFLIVKRPYLREVRK